jgi:hypothetical protein
MGDAPESHPEVKDEGRRMKAGPSAPKNTTKREQKAGTGMRDET